MNRKKFLKGALGMGTIIAIPTVFTSCSDDEDSGMTDGMSSGECALSPQETEGPFPIKSPAELVRENIIGDREGVPMMLVINVQNTNNDCSPIQEALVDVWHCDADGNYSQYDGQQTGDFTNASFCRGRQTTDANGNASFLTIFPGWYPGRAPHIHIEILDSNGNSLLVSQISWSEEVSKEVFSTSEYNGDHDTSNSRDGIVDDDNLADSLTGNTTDGYVMMKAIKVDG